MLNSNVKTIINSARDILVGKLPAPNTQVEQITLAMLYKFMDDIDNEAVELGSKPQYFSDEFAKFSWRNIMKKSFSSQERMNLYVEALEKFSNRLNIPKIFRQIFKNATVPYRDPEVLTLFLKEIDNLNYSDSEVLGDAYEYLLNILGSQGELGQFRTPRHIIDFIISVIKPSKTEKILDPACGTAGFLISAYKYIIKSQSKQLNFDDKIKILDNIFGYDIEPSMVRIAQMNMYLHGCPKPNIYEYDTLTFDDKWNDKFDVIVANPPFFTPKGGITPHNKFSLSSKKAEVLFSEYILTHVKNNGRGAFIVPEGIIANDQNAYLDLRKMMLNNGLYAVVNLHPYVFKPYSGVSTLILFFDKKLIGNKKIYINEVENDGFEKGESRLPIIDNDLPTILDDICKFRELLDKNLSKKDIKNLIKGNVIDDENYGLNFDYHPFSHYVNHDNPCKPISELFNIEKGTVQSSKSEQGNYKLITASDEWSSNKTFSHDCEALVFVFGAGGSLGKTHYVPKQKFIASDLCYILTPKNPSEINLKFYYAYFNSRRKEIVKRLARGTNKKSINDDRFSNYKIYFPKIEIQNKIGKVVEKSFKKIKKYKELIQNELKSIDKLI